MKGRVRVPVPAAVQPVSRGLAGGLLGARVTPELRFLPPDYLRPRTGQYPPDGGGQGTTGIPLNRDPKTLVRPRQHASCWNGGRPTGFLSTTTRSEAVTHLRQGPDQEGGKKSVIGRVQEQAESPSSGSPQASSIVRRIEYKS
jgi:hypothetical protein